MPRLEVAPGVRLHYTRGGVDGAEAVVFVNGLTMDTTAWRPVAQQLGERLATVRYDCRGQGESDKPPGPYTPGRHAADLRALLDGLELERVHLVGLSNGGLIAMLAAGELAEQAGRILSVSVLDSFARVDPMQRWVLASWKSALESGGSGVRFDVATPWVWGHSFLEEHGEELLALREVAAMADPVAVGALIDGLALFSDARRSLRAYDGPLLAAVGKEDLLTPLRYSHEIVEWARHGMLVTVDGAGHAAPIEQPDAVARLLRGFILRHEEFMTPLWQEDAALSDRAAHGQETE
ncbi:MAG TPA: alpha/beta fold hydrolase [Trueperaceae bacterium]